VPALPAGARARNASVDATSRLAQAAASMMEDRTLDQEGLDTIALRLGITDRHLRRAFGAEFGVSPVEFAQTQKLLLAKRLLTDTALPVTEVAFASGSAACGASTRSSSNATGSDPVTCAARSEAVRQ